MSPHHACPPFPGRAALARTLAPAETVPGHGRSLQQPSGVGAGPAQSGSSRGTRSAGSASGTAGEIVAEGVRGCLLSQLASAESNWHVFRGYLQGMGLLRSAAVIGIAKVVYDQARKPENQARLRSIIEQARASRTRQSGAARVRHP